MKESSVAKLFDQLCDMSPTLKRFLIRNWYQLLSTLDKEKHMPYMNLGYASLNAGSEHPLHEHDEPYRYSIQMYLHTIGSVQLQNKAVLEVGSGRGGGAAFVKRFFQPQTLTGVDIAPKAIHFCRNTYQADGLSFRQGDAEALPFESNSFDAVINIESSFSYGHVNRFLSEVYRVLRPEGHLLLADYRDQDRVETLRAQIAEAGFTVQNETRINDEVIRALDLDSARRVKLIKSKVPRVLHNILYDFAGINGTRTHKALINGTVEYLSWTLQKVPVSAHRETEDSSHQIVS